MSLKNLIYTNTETAFKNLGDLVEDMVYRGKPVYDPATGAVTSPADISCRGMAVAYTMRQIDGTLVKAQDKQVLIFDGHISVKPTNEGTIEIDNVVYAIVHVDVDPSGSVHTLQVRK